MQYEIEIKSLLGTQQAADDLTGRIKHLDPGAKHLSHLTQRNHYFTGSQIDELANILDGLTDQDKATMANISQNAAHLSVRTRQNNENQAETILVIKGAKGEGSANHAVERMEFEKTLPIAQDALDTLLVGHGFGVQAKWYAERDKYTYKGAVVEVMFSPGYGYLSEVEYVATDADRDIAQSTVRSIMAELQLTELPGERLERMFAYYNDHWPEYYGTRNVFTVE